ncbi:hypothetical protein ACLOJK_022897 [Asimina triloba]
MDSIAHMVVKIEHDTAVLYPYQSSLIHYRDINYRTEESRGGYYATAKRYSQVNPTKVAKGKCFKFRGCVERWRVNLGHGVASHCPMALIENSGEKNGKSEWVSNGLSFCDSSLLPQGEE